ncbi:uncharacterized protein LOC102700163 isoform X2 [Oryza brachyantha]|uniref:uncharacterized protein LOC102700163 isoform X2 n=1 Tax=Oryza brachyantha TaxID=4533 RepID=UPI000776659C|nr:uncharacterized protein LOC102700163 isoform X2 [Oryza brachyantha]
MVTSDSGPSLRRHSRRRRRLVFDRRYGWMFCVLPMARSLLDFAVSSVTCAADSVSRTLKRSEISSPIAYLPALSLERRQQTWFRELEHVGVIADTKLVPCRTQCSLECMSTDGH